MTQSITDLLGENLTNDPLGEDMTGELTAGYLPDRAIVHVPLMVIGDPVAGPLEDQPLQIFRDTRPLAVDELGMEGPFIGPKFARRAAGRTFPLNYDWGAWFDPTLPGRVPTQETMGPSPFSPGQLPAAHAGVPPIELIEDAYTVPYTASPSVGWPGY